MGLDSRLAIIAAAVNRLLTPSNHANSVKVGISTDIMERLYVSQCPKLPFFVEISDYLVQCRTIEFFDCPPAASAARFCALWTLSRARLKLLLEGLRQAFSRLLWSAALLPL
jgi:hypothetical protein